MLNIAGFHLPFLKLILFMALKNVPIRKFEMYVEDSDK